MQSKKASGDSKGIKVLTEKDLDRLNQGRGGKPAAFADDGGSRGATDPPPPDGGGRGATDPDPDGGSRGATDPPDDTDTPGGGGRGA